MSRVLQYGLAGFLDLIERKLNNFETTLSFIIFYKIPVAQESCLRLQMASKMLTLRRLVILFLIIAQRMKISHVGVFNLLSVIVIVVGLISICQSSGFDSAKIAFATNRDGNWEIYLMNVDETDLVNLTQHPASDFYPAWSPDGKQIAFFSHRDGNYEIYVMNADGSHLRRLTYDEADDKAPAWSPDGKQIAFGSDRTGNFDIYVMNADGSEQRQLTDNQAEDILPAWSPDGNRIAFTSIRDGDFEIYALDLRDGSETRLTASSRQDCYPDWSPDGRKIAFTSARDGDLEIYLMDANGKNVTRLTNNDVDDAVSRWSPDGSKIAYQFECETGNWTLFVMDADGKNKRQLTKGTAWNTEPVWAPMDYISIGVNQAGKHQTNWGQLKDFGKSEARTCSGLFPQQVEASVESQLKKEVMSRIQITNPKQKNRITSGGKINE